MILFLKMTNVVLEFVKSTIKNENCTIPLKFRGKPFLGLAQLSKIILIIFLLQNIGTQILIYSLSNTLVQYEHTYIVYTNITAI